ncbi:histidine kinase [Carnobacterium maltaromaticum]|uniref:sensor histidine kinase n=1 Tax=Carnobacterium maltaromaticum TaxID=2751 RepID=UPI000C7807EF|nr:histidine kinase [Carnobacterium maltaromaticum]PLS32594.1 histidine kinase [Carnobacterium maltaromaticum]PLS32774.1 histidine kinase [Carnobacterium maltaromaticum]PLS33359.1 histidine kinase [Carnobacterium maltaromaticum]PLS40761.1 histidine kinase [Carnobacterium maltaromaticum]PLS41157.1 histidine kinase [Carnobacterium maltaromaticum]
MDKKQHKFQEKNRLLFLKYTFIPIVFLFVIFGISIFSYASWKVRNDTVKASQDTMLAFNGVLATYEKEMIRMANNESVLDYLTQQKKSNLVFEEFYGFNLQQEVKSIFHLVDMKGFSLASSSSEDYLANEIPSYRLKRWKNPKQMVIDVQTNYFSYNKVTGLTLIQPVGKDGEIVGYLIYRLYDEDFQKLLFGKNVDIVVIADQYERIIATTSNRVKGLMGKFSVDEREGNEVLLDSKKYILAENQDSLYGVQVKTLTQKPNYQEVLVSYILLTTISSLVLYFLVNYLAKKMSERNSQSVSVLMSGLDSLKIGELTNFVEIKTGDEFEELTDHYNKMLKNLNQLLLRNEELTYVLQRGEIKFLQSQFNPHFLFNMLETIRYTMVSDQDKAQRIILTLARLLRYSIHQGQNWEILQKDMDYISDYLALHQYRYNNRLSYQIDLDPSLTQVEIPKLLLQPIVENSIKYGYQNQTNLEIKLSVQAQQDKIWITVEDDGPGIATKQLSEIKANLRQEIINLSSIGLYNTDRKIKLIYGEKYGLEIKSTLGLGTIVQIELPLIKDDGDV